MVSKNFLIKIFLGTFNNMIVNGNVDRSIARHFSVGFIEESLVLAALDGALEFLAPENVRRSHISAFVCIRFEDVAFGLSRK